MRAARGYSSRLSRTPNTDLRTLPPFLPPLRIYRQSTAWLYRSRGCECTRLLKLSVSRTGYSCCVRSRLDCIQRPPVHTLHGEIVLGRSSPLLSVPSEGLEEMQVRPTREALPRISCPKSATPTIQSTVSSGWRPMTAQPLATQGLRSIGKESTSPGSANKVSTCCSLLFLNKKRENFSVS